MTRNERLELNKLSKQVYGVSSRWQKMQRTGEVKTLSRTLDDGTEEKYKGIYYPLVEELFNTMQDLKVSLEQEEEEKLKEELENEAKNQAAKIKEIAGSENPEVEEKTKEAGQTVKEILETIES